MTDLTNGNDTYTGGNGDDIINALDGDDIVHGAGGDDQINGGSGADPLYGDDGDDQLNGRLRQRHAGRTAPGNDILIGGSGTDTAVINADGANGIGSHQTARRSPSRPPMASNAASSRSSSSSSTTARLRSSTATPNAYPGCRHTRRIHAAGYDPNGKRHRRTISTSTTRWR